MKPPSGWRWQAGFSLVELMVTMGIALLLLLGVSTVMLYNRQGFNAQKSLAHLQENARLAEFILANNAAAAGYRLEYKVDPEVIFKEKAGFKAGEFIRGTYEKGGNDTLRLRFQAAGGMRDCIGAVGEENELELTDIEFSVKDGVLKCKRYKGSGYAREGTEPLVNHVERFVVHYGLDTDTVDGVDRYVSELEDHEARQVRSVRVQLLLRSENDDVLDKPVEQSYPFTDGSTFTETDRHARLLIDRTIAIRNSK